MPTCASSAFAFSMAWILFCQRQRNHRRERDVVDHLHVRIELEALKDHGDLAAQAKQRRWTTGSPARHRNMDRAALNPLQPVTMHLMSVLFPTQTARI